MRVCANTKLLPLTVIISPAFNPCTIVIVEPTLKYVESSIKVPLTDTYNGVSCCVAVIDPLPLFNCNVDPIRVADIVKVVPEGLANT